MTAHKTNRVAVVGGGIIGTMTAWQLASRGLDVTVFEQWNTPNDRGASAGESRIFRTIYKEGPEYVPLLKKSRDKWDELQACQHMDVLDMCGGVTIGPPSEPDVAAVIDCAKAADLDHRVINAKEMAEEYPQFALDEDEVGVYDPGAGIFRPELAVLAARNESIRHGAEYRSYARVLNIRSVASCVMIDTADGPIGFDSVVIATGPWASELSGLDQAMVAAKRLVAMWFPAMNVSLHQPRSMPISIRRNDVGGFSCFPVVDGAGVKILPHHLPWQDLGDVNDLPRFIEPETVRATEQTVQRLMPGLDPTAVRVSTWTEGFTTDGAPVVGPSPLDDRIMLAVGMSGQGFKFSPMIGSIISDFVENGSSRDSLRIMDPDRYIKEPVR